MDQGASPSETRGQCLTFTDNWHTDFQAEGTSSLEAAKPPVNYMDQGLQNLIWTSVVNKSQERFVTTCTHSRGSPEIFREEVHKRLTFYSQLELTANENFILLMGMILNSCSEWVWELWHNKVKHNLMSFIIKLILYLCFVLWASWWHLLELRCNFCGWLEQPYQACPSRYSSGLTMWEVSTPTVLHLSESQGLATVV